MNNLTGVSLKSSNYQEFYRDFNKGFDFLVFINWAIFSVDVSLQYLTYRTS